MKKLNVLLIIVLLLASLALCSPASASGYVKFFGDCNVRYGPGLDYSILGSVSSGSRLDYAGDYDDDDRNVRWYKVYYNGSIGWVSSLYATVFDAYQDDDDDYSDLIEPYMPLTIESGARGEWNKANDNKLAMRVMVTNISRTRTVKAFDVYMYAENVYGERIYGGDLCYYETTIANVGPGQSTFCNYTYLPNRSNIYKVYACVKRVVCTDGTVLENDNMTFCGWTIT